MAENSHISWTDHTFNPVRGCTKVSPGCEHCYAATLSLRNPSTLGRWGNSGTRIVGVPAYWKQPLKWNQNALEDIDAALHDFGEDSYVLPARPRVFCASLADIFEEWKGDIHYPAKDMEDGIEVA